MANDNTQEELKKKAIENLAASRAAIVVEVRRLRSNVSPTLVLHRLVDGHMGAVLSVAIAVGVGSSLLIFGGTGSSRSRHHAKPRKAALCAPQPTLGSKAMGVIAAALIPALMKSALPALREYRLRSEK